TGEYDYSCTPAMTEAVAEEIPGARFTVMPGMGHFPMVENYPEFRRYLLPDLGRMLAGRGLAGAGRRPDPTASLYGIAPVALTPPPPAEWRGPVPFGRPGTGHPAAHRTS